MGDDTRDFSPSHSNIPKPRIAQPNTGALHENTSYQSMMKEQWQNHPANPSKTKTTS